jgi:hypothetical protein
MYLQKLFSPNDTHDSAQPYDSSFVFRSCIKTGDAEPRYLITKARSMHVASISNFESMEITSETIIHFGNHKKIALASANLLCVGRQTDHTTHALAGSSGNFPAEAVPSNVALIYSQSHGTLDKRNWIITCASRETNWLNLFFSANRLDDVFTVMG